MVAPLWPIIKDKVKWYTALYKCEKCGEYTKRGETNQRQDWTTFVEILNAEQAQALIEERKQMDKAEALQRN
jgi:predicted ATP-dependent serine protease